jgi:hypothetical protein
VRIIKRSLERAPIFPAVLAAFHAVSETS